MEEANSGKQSRFSSDPLIFFSVIFFVGLILVASILNVELTRSSLFLLQDKVAENFSWLFSLTVTFLLVFSIWLAFSRYGQVKLGPQSCKPGFKMISWLAMLFSAGMGIGLVFYGVAEPVLHFITPLNSEPLSANAAREAIKLSVFHWGLHAWAIYVVLGMSLALFHFKYHEPLAIRSTLKPILGRYTHRLPGKIIDILAILGTLFGLATSLGLGASQINAGLFKLFDIGVSVNAQIAIIVVITFCATISLVLGLNKGIRRLSEFNLLLAAALMLFVLLMGSTAALLRGIPDLLGNYLQSLPSLSLSTHPFRSLEWQKAWTIFYWAWWLSWAPFVGTFIARISRGRTIREFVLGVLLIPSVMSLLWFAVFGGASLQLALFHSSSIVATVQQDSALAIYGLLEHFPFSNFMSAMAIFLVAIFFITSSDSGSFVVDMLASGGNPNPPVWQRIFWASMEGLLAIILLMLGGLKALQAGAISMGLVFCFILLAVAYCLRKKLLEEYPKNTLT